MSFLDLIASKALPNKNDWTLQPRICIFASERSKKCARVDQLCSINSPANARQVSIDVGPNYQ